tara:strand:- start:4088 stop:5032 length:945 start_codon:yes stop_codon:yes gene_type:complete
MATEMIKRYPLKYFKEREKNIENLQNILSDKTIEIINNLAQHVGAPEYQRTPIFKKEDKFKRRPNTQSTTVEDWEAMRNFKPTVLAKSEEDIDKEINEIRILLNKITSKNYDDMHKKVIDLLKNVISRDPKEEDMLKIGNSIFEIGSMNKFWSKLYAKLLKDIIEIFPIMKIIYNKSLDNFMIFFENIRFMSSEENYDKFCLINKENEKRRSLSSFFVHLMNNDLLSINIIGDIVLKLVNKFKNDMDNVDKKEIINELGENICIFVLEGGDKLESSYENFKEINDFIKDISDSSNKIHPGLTSKIIFKFLDIIE